MLTIAYVAFFVIAGVPTYPASDQSAPFGSEPDCWEWVDHALERGAIKLGEGVKVACYSKIEESEK